MSQRCISVFKYTKEDVERSMKLLPEDLRASPYIHYYLVPITSKKKFWQSKLWENIDSFQGEVFFY